jgi:hypothetical protein
MLDPKPAATYVHPALIFEIFKAGSIPPSRFKTKWSVLKPWLAWKYRDDALYLAELWATRWTREKLNALSPVEKYFTASIIALHR